MWYDDPFVKFKKGKTNKRRRRGREPILMVSAKVAQQRREHMQRLATVVLCLVAMTGAIWVTFAGGRLILRKLFMENPDYAIRDFDIRTDGSRMPKALIMEFAGLEAGVNIFAIDIEDVRQSLRTVPLIQDVLVRRVLPDRLLLQITERVAVARFGSHNRSYPMAIDRHGMVMGRGSRSSNLPLITGPGTGRYRPGQKVDDQPVQDALRVLEILGNSRGLTRLVHIDKIDTGNPRYLKLYLREGQAVPLGREDMETKLGELAVWIQYMDETGESWKELDLTFSKNMPAVL